jgi:hypothetical protein
MSIPVTKLSDLPKIDVRGVLNAESAFLPVVAKLDEAPLRTYKAPFDVMKSYLESFSSNIQGSLTVQEDLDVIGVTRLSKSLNVAGDFGVKGKSALGEVEITSLSTTGDAAIAGNITSRSLRYAALSTRKIPLGSDGTIVIDCAAGSYFSVEFGQEIRLHFDNWSEYGINKKVELEVVVFSSHAKMFLPGSATINVEGIIGYNTALHAIEFPCTGKFNFVFSTSDEGYSILVEENNSLLKTYNSGTQCASDSPIKIDLSKTYTVYTPEIGYLDCAGFLDNGVNGQTKVITSTGSGQFEIELKNTSWTGTIGNVILDGQSTVTLVWLAARNYWMPLNTCGTVIYTA